MIPNYDVIIGDEFEPPSHHEIRGNLLRKEVDKTLDMLQKHREKLKKTGCSIMCVDWTNIKGQSLCKIE